MYYPFGLIRPGRPQPGALVNPVATIKWRLIACHLGAHYLHEVALSSTDRRPDVIQKLLQEYRRSEPWPAKAVPFLVPTVYTTQLSPAPIENISKDLPCLVEVDEERYPHILRTAPAHLDMLPSRPDFLSSYSRFAITNEPVGATRTRDAILVKLQLHKPALLIFSALVLILSAFAGVLAGIFRHSLDTGLGVFGSAVSAIGVVEGYLTWRLNQ